MFVVKKSGKKESINLGKISKRIEKMTPGLDIEDEIIQMISGKVLGKCYENITTRKIDDILLQVLEENIDENKQIEALAARVAVSNLHKDTRSKFSSSMKLLHDNNKISDEVYEFIKENKTSLDNCIVGDRDFNYDLKTFKKISKELGMVGDKTVERVQYYILRQSLHTWKYDVDHVVRDYHMKSCNKDLLLSCIL